MDKRILVLDDNQDILDVVKEVLAYEGFEVTCISEAALLDKAILQCRPHVILLDYRLMDGNGGDICNKLKAAEATRRIPVIIFSAYPLGGQALKSLNPDAILAKPFDIQELVDTISRILDAV